MVDWFSAAGHDTIHTLDLPDQNRSTDDQVIEFADREMRILITKDADFVNTYLLQGRPAKLLLVSTGNIRNQELEMLVKPLIPTLDREFQTHSFIEFGRTGLAIRG